MPLVEVPVTLWKVYQESPGVYFEHLGHVTLSHTSWTLVVYVPLYSIDNETFHLEKYVRYIEETCSKMILKNWTACYHFGEIMAHKLRHIKTTRQLLLDCSGKEREQQTGEGTV